MGNFHEDLKKGKAAELRALSILNSELGLGLIVNPIEKEMDLIPGRGCECKFDEYASYSGNFYIEFECGGKPSGLFREEKLKLKWWAHIDGAKLFLLDGDKLKAFTLEMIEKCRANKSNTHRGFRVVEKGGNGGRTKGLLIPRTEMEKISEYIFPYSEEENLLINN